MPSIRLIVECEGDKQTPLIHEILEKQQVDIGIEKKLPGGATITFDGFPMKKSASHGVEHIDFILRFSRDVSAILVAKWLDGKFQKQGITRIKTLTRKFDKRGMEVLNVTEIETTQEEFSKLLHTVVQENLESD